MKTAAKSASVTTQPVGAEPVWGDGEQGDTNTAKGMLSRLLSNSDFGNVLATFLTTLAIFGVYLIQGIVVARILGPLGRGEFGTAMFFPRDVFLYAGLLGGIEIVNAYAVQGTLNIRSLKYSAAKVGLISGIITAIISAATAAVVLVGVGKAYLIPYSLICCLFIPWEHMQLTISAVDRGAKNFRFYNVNRLLFAVSFLVLVTVVFGLKLNTVVSLSPLTLICILFVAARVVGILPTLRGMNVAQGLLDSIGMQHAIDTTEQIDDLVAVPGPWALLKKGRYFALSMLASETFEKLDMFLIVAIASVAESGYYFVAVPAAQLLIVAPSALGVFTFNAGADKQQRVSVRKAIGFMLGTAVLQIVSAIVLAVLVPILIIAFFKTPFAPAIPFALWLLPACAIKGYLSAVDGYLKGRGKPMIGVKARFLSIFVMLGFVGAVFGGLIPGPEQKLLSIPIAACLGQATSMVIISWAVIQDTIHHQNTMLTVVEDSDVRD